MKTLEQYQDKFPEGAVVTYFPVMGSFQDPLYTVTRSPVWTLCSGHHVVALKGKSGSVSVEHLLESDPRDLAYQEIIDRLERTVASIARELDTARETLRDQFAMAALTGLLSAPWAAEWDWAKTLKSAYEAADAAILARQTEETQTDG